MNKWTYTRHQCEYILVTCITPNTTSLDDLGTTMRAPIINPSARRKIIIIHEPWQSHNRCCQRLAGCRERPAFSGSPNMGCVKYRSPNDLNNTHNKLPSCFILTDLDSSQQAPEVGSDRNSLQPHLVSYLHCSFGMDRQHRQ
jgi:hypothetical protein